MIKYIVILLDDTSPSFCHYNSTKREVNLMELDILKDAVSFAMKENCIIQYVLPDYQLSDNYIRIIEDMNHVNIVSNKSKVEADVIVVDGFDELSVTDFKHGVSYVLRTDVDTFIDRYHCLVSKLENISRLNIVFTDIEKFTDNNVKRYYNVLSSLATRLGDLAGNECYPQINLLTDRLYLHKMNNCNAGVECVTLAPDGKFYVCPGFYYDGLGDIGSLKDGLRIKNPQLYTLNKAPICRKCDAYHCKRCVWLNRKLTLEVNTPSYEQCLISHLERNATREYMQTMKCDQTINQIPEISYLDPLEKILNR